MASTTNGRRAARTANSQTLSPEAIQAGARLKRFLCALSCASAFVLRYTSCSVVLRLRRGNRSRAGRSKAQKTKRSSSQQQAFDVAKRLQGGVSRKNLRREVQAATAGRGDRGPAAEQRWYAFWKFSPFVYKVRTTCTK
eukprot:4835748-Pleurochrysis_carterae.AAC.2